MTFEPAPRSRIDGKHSLERVLEGGEDAGDGDDEEVRRELGLEEDGDFS